jgi:hypothetical protein
MNTEKPSSTPTTTPSGRCSMGPDARAKDEARVTYLADSWAQLGQLRWMCGPDKGVPASKRWQSWIRRRYRHGRRESFEFRVGDRPPVVRSWWPHSLDSPDWERLDNMGHRPQAPAVIIQCLAAVRSQIGLTDKQWDAFELSAGYGKSQPQIALALGVAQSSVNERLASAWQRVKEWQAATPDRYLPQVVEAPSDGAISFIPTTAQGAERSSVADIHEAPA